MRWGSEPGNCGYEHLKVVGRCCAIVPNPQVRPTRFRICDTLYHDYVPENLKVQLEPRIGEFYLTQADAKSLDISIRKMDFARVTLYKQNACWKEAVDLVYNMNMEVWKSGIASPEEFVILMDFDTASGCPWAQLGLKKKKDCVKSPYVMAYTLDIDRVIKERPIWRVVGKREWMHKDLIDKGKVRTFIIPPFHLYWWQCVLFHRQGVAIKLRWWSAYGFNPYMGGVNVMAKRLLTRRKYCSYDVAGWDRRLPVMRKIYRMRCRYHPEYLRDVSDWTAENSCCSLLVLPNGVVVEKDIGNNSGSKKTTDDNIVGHELILTYSLMNYYRNRASIKRDPEFHDLPAYLFGDDNIMGLDDIDDNDVFEEEMRGRFGDFGLGLDPFLISENLEDHTFLGFKFKQLDSGDWIPMFDQSRLLASFCFMIEVQDKDAQISKMWALTLMAAGGERYTFELMRRATKSVLKNLEWGVSPVIDSLKRVGLPNYDRVLAFYLGIESSSEESEWWEVAVKILNDVGETEYREESQAQGEARQDCCQTAQKGYNRDQAEEETAKP